MHSTSDLQKKSKQVRLDVLDMIFKAGKGHIGGIYSCADILVALYYGGVLRLDPKNPKWENRDRFLMGKGHACLGAYVIYKDLGLISEEIFNSYGQEGGLLGGQFDIRNPMGEYNTGSLGHVVGIGAGIALAAKMDQKDYKAYCLIGDAECYEGSIWEAILFAGKHRLKNLVTIIDRNRLSVTEVLDDEAIFGNFAEKCAAFGWESHVVDGHNISEILETLDRVRSAKKPVMILAKTIKGKGISFMENGIKWHHAVPNAEQYAAARKELLS